MQDHLSVSPRAPKPVWTPVSIATIQLRAALGATAGPLCDKHGSLSRGTGC